MASVLLLGPYHKRTNDFMSLYGELKDAQITVLSSSE